MKKKTKHMILILLSILIVYMSMVIMPFVYQPKVSSQTQDKVAQTEFYNDTFKSERAYVIEDNGEALEERIRLISQAKESVVLSTFEFRSDESGKDILSALIMAAHRGVKIQVLIDGLAAMTRMSGNDYFVALSALKNAQIKIYNCISLMKPANLMARMHDKYLMVDNKTYILGGRNTYDYFLGNHNGYKNYDWDVLVYQQKNEKNTSVHQLYDYFHEVWDLPNNHLYRDDVQELKKTKVIKAKEELEERYKNLQKEKPKWFEKQDYLKKTKPTNHIELITNPIQCQTKEPVVFYTLTQLMSQAKKEVIFHTPYIIGNDWMMESLQQVCQNVPQVIMMTNSVANNGNPFGAMDYKKHKKTILKTGVRILEYDAGVSYHGKCMSIDNQISVVGSFNWDMRSVYLDTEMMVVIDSREVNAQLREKMQNYEKNALEVKDEKNYNIKDNQKPQKLDLFRRLQLFFMQIFVGWLRFLM